MDLIRKFHSMWIPKSTEDFGGQSGGETLEQVGDQDSKSPRDDRLEGKITRLEFHMNLGVIDGTYRFRMSDIRSNEDVQVGMKVTFIAKQDPFSADSVAVDIAAIVEKGSCLLEQERARLRKLIVKVLKVENEFVVAGKDDTDSPIQIPKDYLPKDYQPILSGDWLEVDLEAISYDDGSMDAARAKIISVKWSEKCELRGEEVTSSDGLISISHTIYFTKKVVKGNRLLKPGDKVNVVVIASDQVPQEKKEDGLAKVYQYRKRALEVTCVKPEESQPGPRQSDHQELQVLDPLEHQIQKLISDKNGIKVCPPDYLRFDSVVIGGITAKTIMIHNFGAEPISLKSIKPWSVQDVSEFTFEYQKYEGDEEILIYPRVPFIVKVQCKVKQLGRTDEMCVFTFGRSGSDVVIGRWLKVYAAFQDEQLIKRTKKSVGESWQRKNANHGKMAAVMYEDHKRSVVAGPRMFRAAFFIPNRIENYRIPDYMYKIFEKQDEEELTKRHPIDFSDLTPENYMTRFKVSLWLEELENQLLRKSYDLEGVELQPHGDLFALTVPSLKEIVPPVLMGDQIECIVKAISKDRFTASIERIISSELADPIIHLKFSEKFHHLYRGTLVDRVHFCLGRTAYRRQHFAVIQAMKHLGTEWLFPNKLILKTPRVKYFEVEGDELHPIMMMVKKSVRKRPQEKRQSDQQEERQKDQRAASMRGPFESNVQAPPPEFNEFRLRWYNGNLNKEQRDAVRRILSAQGRPLPYVIFGPPGTGKTVTVVEAIMQIYFLEPSSRILVTVPSNSAADLIAERLAATGLFNPGDFIRLNGFMRSEVTVPDTIADFCADGTYLDAVAKHRMIICTVTTAGQFFQLNLNTGHFSHVFVDEAGYCTEPEAMIPCVLAAIDKEAVVVLAGDPQQLGPVLMNDMKINTFLGTSLLERMMGREIYQRDEKMFPETKYNTAVLTKLVRSYRAHPELLKIPSELFYNDELVSCASDASYQFCGKNVEFLPRQDIPMIFHGIRGTCSQDHDSPSWFNIGEVGQVVAYMLKLRSLGISVDDIGIITPYRKQVEKLRLALEYRLMEKEIPKIASVQEFQGGERKVIIISTVRSEYRDILEKKVSRMDFLYSRKLFNVAITRAKALMIIVGNPDVLHHNKYWNRLLEYCISQGVYKGCDLPPKLNERFLTAVKSLEDSKMPDLVMADDDDDDEDDLEDLDEDGYAVKDQEPIPIL